MLLKASIFYRHSERNEESCVSPIFPVCHSEALAEESTPLHTCHSERSEESTFHHTYGFLLTVEMTDYCKPPKIPYTTNVLDFDN